MSDVQAFIDAARSSGDWSRLTEAVPYLRFMGIGVEVRDGKLLGHLRATEMHVGNPTIPALHGGTLGALLELTAQLELLFRAETAVLPKTITLTIDYLRSGKLQDVFAEATVLKQGRRVTTVRAVAWQDDPAKPIATATLHLLIIGG